MYVFRPENLIGLKLFSFGDLLDSTSDPITFVARGLGRSLGIADDRVQTHLLDAHDDAYIVAPRCGTRNSGYPSFSMLRSMSCSEWHNMLSTTRSRLNLPRAPCTPPNADMNSSWYQSSDSQCQDLVIYRNQQTRHPPCT
jgi:hypothetical protein